MKTLRRIVTWLAFGLLIASVLKELRKPEGERTWHGTVASFVPYDLRIPSLERVRQAFWDPGNPDLLVPTAFGVGWSLNLAATVRRNPTH